MARKQNSLLTHLLSNEDSRRAFIELVQKTTNKRDVAKLLRDGEFENTTWYISGQTIGNIMKRLGYVGSRGRPSLKSDSQQRWKIR